jgi:hypothetical protein
MQRGVSTFIGLAVVVLAVWLVVRDFHLPPAIGRDPVAADAGAGDASPGASVVPEAAAPPASAAGAEPPFVSDFAFGARRMDPYGGVPALPAGAPRQVRFGVVLVSYVGAQPSAAIGSRPAKRSKEEARALADKLRATADTDFHAAVQQGDIGSADDVGRVQQGILEPPLEYQLFTLPPGQIAGPWDTPRGFWIVRRFD